MTTWICRTWIKDEVGWTSGFDRFDTEAEAYDFGRIHMDNLTKDELTRDFEVWQMPEYDPADASEIIKKGLYGAAVELMDDDIREELHREIAPCSETDFLEAYMKRHLAVHGIPFII